MVVGLEGKSASRHAEVKMDMVIWRMMYIHRRKVQVNTDTDNKASQTERRRESVKEEW